MLIFLLAVVGFAVGALGTVYLLARFTKMFLSFSNGGGELPVIVVVLGWWILLPFLVIALPFYGLYKLALLIECKADKHRKR